MIFILSFFEVADCCTTSFLVDYCDSWGVDFNFLGLGNHFVANFSRLSPGLSFDKTWEGQVGV